MSGFKGDLEDLEDGPEMEMEDEGGDDFAFDDEDDEGDGGKSGKKEKSESSTFDRDSYYFYKDKLVQLSGTIRPKERAKDGKVVSLEFKTDDKVYAVVMDDMGKKLTTSCFQELLVTGLVSKVSEKEYTIAIKTYI